MSRQDARVQFLAKCMDDLVPWTSACEAFRHTDWTDLLVCMQQHSPAAVEKLYKEFATPFDVIGDGCPDPADKMDEWRDKQLMRETNP